MIRCTAHPCVHTALHISVLASFEPPGSAVQAAHSEIFNCIVSRSSSDSSMSLGCHRAQVAPACLGLPRLPARSVAFLPLHRSQLATASLPDAVHHTVQLQPLLADLTAAAAGWQPAGNPLAALTATIVGGIGLAAAYAAYLAQEAGGLGACSSWAELCSVNGTRSTRNTLRPAIRASRSAASATGALLASARFLVLP